MHPHALAAVSLADLACALWGSQPAGMRWLVEWDKHGMLRHNLELDDAVTKS